VPGSAAADPGAAAATGDVFGPGDTVTVRARSIVVLGCPLDD